VSDAVAQGIKYINSFTYIYSRLESDVGTQGIKYIKYIGIAVYVFYSLCYNIRHQSTVYIGKAVYVFYSLFSSI
jgi:hypothetical protein